LFDPLSHAGAYAINKSTKIIAGCSTDKKDRDDFNNKYKVPIFKSAKEMLAKVKPDIVSICSPTEYHYEHSILCLKNNIPMIWLEKPSVKKFSEIQELTSLLSNNKNKILVNYPRRFLSNYNNLKKIYHNAELGKPKDIVLHYSKGLLVNGSHIIDSLFMIIDSGKKIKKININIIKKGENPSFIIEYGKIPIYVIGHDVPYHSREISITFEDGRISINQEGHCYIYEKRVEQKFYPGYFQLDSVKKLCNKANDYDKALSRALSNLILSHEKNIMPKSNLHTSLPTQKVIEIVTNANSR